MTNRTPILLINRRDLLLAGAFMTTGSMIAEAKAKYAVSAGVRPRIAPGPPPGHVSVPDFRTAGDTDDSSALTRAIATGRPVYMPKHRGSLPDGSYAAHRVALRPFTNISGDGPATVVRPTSASTSAVFACMAASAEKPIPGITLRDLALVGHVASSGFSEHLHLINLSGVSGVRIEYVTFSGFRGDGLMLGAEFADAPEREPRFNEDVTISNCLFDGINRENRNGISVIGGTRITIDHCSFTRCTRPTMPGPIDFEPDSFPFYRLDRLAVTRCHFSECGGNLAQVSVHVPEAVTHIPVGIKITGNVFTTYHGSGADVHLSINRMATPDTPDMQVIIADNHGSDGFAGVRIYSGRGVVVVNNSWVDYTAGGCIGYVGTANTVQNITVSDNYERCGSSSGHAFSIYNARGATLTHNVFRNCGNASPSASCLYFGPGATSDISLIANDFADNPVLTNAISRDVMHRSSSATERRIDNHFGTLIES